MSDVFEVDETQTLSEGHGIERVDVQDSTIPVRESSALMSASRLKPGQRGEKGSPYYQWKGLQIMGEASCWIQTK